MTCDPRTLDAQSDFATAQSVLSSLSWDCVG